MSEPLSTSEVAHAIGHRHKTHDEKRAELVEIIEAILLAIVAVATAWSGYETGRWDGRQAHLYGLSSKERAAQTRAATLSGQQRIYDTTTFGFWLQQKTEGKPFSAALFERRFRPEYRVAFNAWIKTNPLHNPKAPAGPIFMPQYHNAAAERANRHDERASAYFAEGTKARENGDHFLRNTILLATVLLLTALAQRFKVLAVRVGLLVVAACLLAVALYFVITYPVA